MTKAIVAFILAGVVMLIAIPIGIVRALLVGWAVRVIWPWFIASPPPSLALVVGAVIIFHAFFNEHAEGPKAKDLPEAFERASAQLAIAFLGPFIIIAVAWLTHLFVTVKPWP